MNNTMNNTNNNEFTVTGLFKEKESAECAYSALRIAVMTKTTRTS